jgi:type II secretory pathway component GspD/PulD (secretin)
MPATNVSITIINLLRQEAEFYGSAATPAKSGPVMRVAITPETVTNSLVISGPPDAVDEVRQLAEALDQTRPQVQIDMEMGEVAAGEAKHGESLKSEGSAPPAEKPNTFYVLERPKTMKTLARAQVVTLDNQPASIHLLQRVATVASVTRTASGPMSALTYQNVGSILALTPRINVKEGTIVLQVDAEDSHMGPENEGTTFAVVDNKEYRSRRLDSLTLQTTLMVPDGKTIMLGSIGRQGNADSELVVILTPHIIRPEDAQKTAPAGSVPPPPAPLSPAKPQQ